MGFQRGTGPLAAGGIAFVLALQVKLALRGQTFLKKGSSPGPPFQRLSSLAAAAARALSLNLSKLFSRKKSRKHVPGRARARPVNGIPKGHGPFGRRRHCLFALVAQQPRHSSLTCWRLPFQYVLEISCCRVIRATSQTRCRYDVITDIGRHRKVDGNEKF
jgi:hypothetical protein